ncbi:MAG: right-handed parallel beta-helix repeat-containing protein [Candidatus Cloacimonetes bacterium]|jgi:hypothetical protein|nr:right-handed parallel beta-helix repeat-containing protein [Candidatus Cloacimonadota bacterium]MDD2209780.1 right-handed parallel beta-helix repeat-containing protein [Candidatus Cloacimonadota bacterium]MDD4231966.1 right-handed parallel beta-helix repeat-containing protein [Candidatus Cloacimonadota bacterium]MDY0298296.1 right-handed parallel beta-helix repeat-containing protein [Candidatus Cloacimonadaceae bacterium]
MKTYAILFLILLMIPCLSAIDVSGVQSGIWTADDNPHNLVGDVTVPAGSVLTIQPGVIVKAMGSYRINAEGSIQAIGTEGDSIRFENGQIPSSNLWKGIRLENETEPSNFMHCVVEYAEYGINAVDSPVEVSYSRFSYNQRGLHLYGIGNLHPAVMEVHNNIIEHTQQNGILVPQNSNAWIHHNEVRYNGTVTQYYGAIQLSNQSPGGQNNPIIEHNYIHHNYKQGITAWDIVGASAINPIIRYNIIESNLTGIYLLNASGTVHNNQIINNFIPGDANSGAGLMISGATSVPFIAENIITGNFTGFYITNNALPCLGDMSLNHPWAYGMNVIRDNIDESNTLYSIVCATYPNSNNVIMAEGNDWGVYSATEIHEGIIDHNDNTSLPTVDFEPWYEGQGIINITGSFSRDTEDYPSLAAHELQLHLVDTESGQILESHFLQSNPFSIESEVNQSFYALITGMDPSLQIFAAPGGLVNPTEFDASTGEYIDLGNIYIDAWQHYIKERRGESEIIAGREIWPVYKSVLFLAPETIDYFYDEGDYRYIFKHQHFDGADWQTVDFGFDQTYEQIDNLSHSYTWQQHYVENGVPVEYIVGLSIDDTGNRTYVTMDQSWNQLLRRNVGEDYERIYVITDGSVSTMLEVEEPEPGIKYMFFNLPPQNPAELGLRSEIVDETSYNLEFWWNPPAMTEYEFEVYNLYWQRNGEEPQIYTTIPIYHTSWTLWGVTGNGTYHFWLTATDGESETQPSNFVTITLSSSNEDLVQMPQIKIYPNPISFKGNSALHLSVKGMEKPMLKIYNLRGQRVLSTNIQDDQYSWNGKDANGQAVGSGVYFMRVEDANKQCINKKIIVTN